MTSSLDVFPRQVGGRVADLAGLLWGVLQPIAGSAVLQHQPSLIDGIPERLAQRVGNGDQLRHRFIPARNLSDVPAAPPSWWGLAPPSTSLSIPARKAWMVGLRRP